jgi:signal transduction histidine kinase
MFHSARIKLTAWYLLIITLISVSFSFVVYKILTSELDRVERIQRLRMERNSPERFGIVLPPEVRDQILQPFQLDLDLIQDAKNRLAVILTLIDLGILASSTVAGYFLAGRTLRPIQIMVDDQNQFITDASHELRTPLTSLKSEIEVNLRDPKLSLTDAKKLLRSNLEEVDNLQSLSDGLIKLTQFQSVNNGLSLSDIALNTLVDEAIKKVANLAKTKHIKIQNLCKPINFVGNKPTLLELLIIFLDNAIKYSPSQTEVVISSHTQDGFIFIYIKDHGYGIEPNDLPHLFDRFYRADKSRTKTEIPGYGLGLSIAKQIIARHHGGIKVTSKLNEGSTFTIKIPIKKSSN